MRWWELEMNKYILKSDDKEVIKAALQLFQDLGYKLGNCDRSGMVYAKDGNVECDRLEFWSYYSDQEGCQELTLPQLRDLVAQIKSKVREYLDPNDNHKLCLINPSDATHWMIEVPKGAELYVYWPLNGEHNFQSGQSFYEDGIWNPCSFSVEEIKKGDAGADILWSREPIQEQGLISGSEALERIAEGVVQYKCIKDPVADRWTTITDNFWDQYNLGLFLNKDTTWRFRLKPRTIKLELEIPAPFEPKVGEEYFCIQSCRNGYAKSRFNSEHCDQHLVALGAWRTEEEIKQVVAALRGIKG